MQTHVALVLARVGQFAVVGFATALVTAPGWCQVPGVPKVKEAVEPAAGAAQGAAGQARKAGRDAAKDARGAAEDARDPAKDAIDDARKDAADAAKGARREGREAGRDARETARDTRRDARQAARDLRAENVRAADLGLWLNARAGGGGLVIADVAAQGAIAKIGFREGDRIVSINGTPVRSEAEFVRLLLADDLRNERVKVIVLRGDREQIVYVQPVLLIDEMVVYDPLWQYGLVIDDRYSDRIVVLRIYPRTPAFYAGLRAGDVIVSLGGRRIAAVNDLARAFADADGSVALQVNRANRTRELEIDTSTAIEGRTRATLRPDIGVETEGRVEGRAKGRTEGRAKGRAEEREATKERADPADTKPRLEKPSAEKPGAEQPGAEKPSAEQPKVEKPRVELPETPAPAPKAPGTPKVPSVPKQ